MDKMKKDNYIRRKYNEPPYAISKKECDYLYLFKELKNKSTNIILAQFYIHELRFLPLHL